MLSRRVECQINLGNKRGMPGAIVFSFGLSRFKGQQMLCSWSPTATLSAWRWGRPGSVCMAPRYRNFYLTCCGTESSQNHAAPKFGNELCNIGSLILEASSTVN